MLRIRAWPGKLYYFDKDKKYFELTSVFKIDNRA